MRIRVVLLCLGLVTGLATPLPAGAVEISECRVSTSPGIGVSSGVSLGFPQPIERLAAKANPRILVVPFRLSDTPKAKFTNEIKESYLKAKRTISNLSNGQNQVEFIFNAMIDTTFTRADLIKLKRDTLYVSKRDETKSTPGFVRNFIETYDKILDLRDIDAVYLQGPPPSPEELSLPGDMNIAEAFQFFENPKDQLFRPVITNEGKIYNFVLHTGDVGNADTIIHEIMHMYGLVDFYRGENFPIGLSMMSSYYFSRLLNYERWVLGWVKDNQVQCLIEGKQIKEDVVSTRIKIPTKPIDQMVIIRTSAATSAFIAEISSDIPPNSPKSRMFYFYLLQNEGESGPVSMAGPVPPGLDGILISNEKNWLYSEIGSYLKIDKYALLISDIDDQEITLDLILTTKLDEAQPLIKIAKDLGERRMLELRNRQRLLVSKSIKCVNGKISKVIKGPTPKCPKGFRPAPKKR